MKFAVPIVFIRLNAMACHHLYNSTSNIRIDIALLRTNKPASRKKAPTVRRLNNWHTLHSDYPSTNLPHGSILIDLSLPFSHKK